MRVVSYAPVQRLFHPRGAPCILAYSSVTSGSKYATAGRRARLFGRAEKTKAFMGLSALVTNASHSKRLTSAIASVVRRPGLPVSAQLVDSQTACYIKLLAS